MPHGDSMKLLKTGRFPRRFRRPELVAALVALLLSISGCGDACVGYTSFTDANGLIVLVDCDGVAFVVTPTPGTRP